ACLLLHAGNERLAAARHDDVDIATKAAQHLAHGFAIGGRDNLDRRLGQAGTTQPVDQAGMDGAHRIDAVRAAAQDHRIARFQRQGTGVGGDIGPTFEDDADDAERRAHPLDVEPVRPVPFGYHLADRIGQAGDRLQAGNHGVYTPVVELEAIEEGAGYALLLRCRHVEGIGREDVVAAHVERGGSGEEGCPLRLVARKGEHLRRGAGLAAEFQHHAAQIDGLESAHGRAPRISTMLSRCTSSLRASNPSRSVTRALFLPLTSCACSLSSPTRPRATSLPAASRMDTVSPRAKLPVTRVTPTGRRLLPASRAATAPSSI